MGITGSDYNQAEQRRRNGGDGLLSLQSPCGSVESFIKVNASALKRKLKMADHHFPPMGKGGDPERGDL